VKPKNANALNALNTLNKNKRGNKKGKVFSLVFLVLKKSNTKPKTKFPLLNSVVSFP